MVKKGEVRVMKKLGLSVSVLLLVSAVLTGCGGGGVTATRDTYDPTLGFSLDDERYKTAAEKAPILINDRVIQSNVNSPEVDINGSDFNFKKVAAGGDVTINSGDLHTTFPLEDQDPQSKNRN